MTGIHDLWLFVLSGLLLNMTPGVDTLYIVARGAAQGWRAGAVAALGIAQRAYLIENGRVVMTGSAESLASNPDVQEFYLGGAQGQHKDYHAVKHYRRRKRWLS